MAKFRDFSRLRTVGGTTLVGCSGDMADLQQLTTMLADLDTSNEEWADGHAIRPKAIHSFLTRVFYNKCARAFALWDEVAAREPSRGGGS